MKCVYCSLCLELWSLILSHQFYSSFKILCQSYLFLTPPKTLLGRTLCCLKCVYVDLTWVPPCCFHSSSAPNTVAGIKPVRHKVPMCLLNETAQGPNPCIVTIFCTCKVTPVQKITHNLSPKLLTLCLSETVPKRRKALGLLFSIKMQRALSHSFKLASMPHKVRSQAPILGRLFFQKAIKKCSISNHQKFTHCIIFQVWKLPQ